MIEFPISHGVTMIDDADLAIVEGRRWWPLRAKTTTYAYTRLKNGLVVGMHRLLLDPPRGMWVDHRDGNGLNNQRSNIRLAAPSQNACNSKGRGTSPFRGVYWHKQARKWHAQIKVGEKRLSLGMFDDETEAATAYDRAAIVHFGEFANLNVLTRQ